MKNKGGIQSYWIITLIANADKKPGDCLAQMGIAEQFSSRPYFYHSNSGFWFLV